MYATNFPSIAPLFAPIRPTILLKVWDKKDSVLVFLWFQIQEVLLLFPALIPLKLTFFSIEELSLFSDHVRTMGFFL